jgi:hypothetical protein
LGYLLNKKLFQCLSHNDNIFAGLVVDITVLEHQIEIAYAFLGLVVVVDFKAFFDCAQVHGLGDYLVVVL